jgi:hypothetical protein
VTTADLEVQSAATDSGEDFVLPLYKRRDAGLTAALSARSDAGYP